MQRLLLLLAALLCGLAACSTGTRTDLVRTDPFRSEAPSPPAPQLTVLPPKASVQVDGQAHTAYELLVHNPGPVPVRLLRLAVLDDRTGQPMLQAEGGALLQRLDAPTAAQAGTLAPGASATVFIELQCTDALPQQVLHRLSARADAQALSAEARTALPAERAVVIGPPVTGGPWVAVHDPRWAQGHRRVFRTRPGTGALSIPGRFAIDFVRVDAQGQAAWGDTEIPSHWWSYGATAVAVADGVVASVTDGKPEAARVSENGVASFTEAAGNHVALDIGHGRFAHYEHLRPGSIGVRVGQRVRRGMPIGQAGFSGQSTGPHLHFHVAAGPDPVYDDGLPFAFERFEELGRYDDTGRAAGGPWRPAPAQRRQAFPAPAVVMRLAD